MGVDKGRSRWSGPQEWRSSFQEKELVCECFRTAAAHNQSERHGEITRMRPGTSESQLRGAAFVMVVWPGTGIHVPLHWLPLRKEVDRIVLVLGTLWLSSFEQLVQMVPPLRTDLLPRSMGHQRLSVSGSSRIQILLRCESCPIQGLRSAKTGNSASPKRRAPTSPAQVVW
jgi:hypothetical protein